MIRPMTDEERQRAKERAVANKVKPMLTDLEIRTNDEARHAHRELVEKTDALVAAAYEAAANEVDCGGCGGTCADPSNCHSKDAAIIRALTPADAKAALDRLIAEAEERGAQRERELQRKWETGDE